MVTDVVMDMVTVAAMVMDVDTETVMGVQAMAVIQLMVLVDMVAIRDTVPAGTLVDMAVIQVTVLVVSQVPDTVDIKVTAPLASQDMEMRATPVTVLVDSPDLDTVVIPAMVQVVFQAMADTLVMAGDGVDPFMVVVRAMADQHMVVQVTVDRVMHHHQPHQQHPRSNFMSGYVAQGCATRFFNS